MKYKKKSLSTLLLSSQRNEVTESISFYMDRAKSPKLKPNFAISIKFFTWGRSIKHDWVNAIAERFVEISHVKVESLVNNCTGDDVFWIQFVVLAVLGNQISCDGTTFIQAKVTVFHARYGMLRIHLKKRAD